MRTATGIALVLALVGCKGDAPTEDAPKAAAEPEAAAQAEGGEAPSPVAKRDEEPPEPPKPQAYVPKTPADYVGKHVLVPHGAKLRVAPNDEAEFAALELLERTDGAPATRTFDVVGSEGEFIAVRPALEDKRCTDPVPGLASFDIKLWVRPHELAPVLGLRTEVKGPDGDVATLWPGVPVGSNAAEATVDLDGLALTVPLDPAVISTAFEPEELPVIAEAAKSLGAGPSMTWGGTAVGDQYLLDGGALAPAAIVEKAAASGKRVATVWTTCAELTGKVDERRPEMERLTAKKAGMYGIKGMTSRDVTTYEVREGADVFWRDGGKAGVVASSHEFSFKPKTRKSKKCFRLALMEKGETKRAPPKDSQLELCFDEIDITEHLSMHEHMASVGILGVLGTSSGSSLSALGTFESSLDDEDVWGGLTGTEIGEAYGVGGLGLSGTGAGGGGTGEGTIGLGTIGTIGGSRSTGSSSSSAKVKQGKTTSSGDLDGDIARRIIRAHRNEIRYCYSKVLADKEGASGSIKLSISVGPTGKVSSASTSDDTVGDIASCIEKAAKRWKFPKASGVSVVSTKFTFTSL